MHVHFLDPYRPRPSPIHRLDPRVKFILTLAFILTTALMPMGAWPIYILLFSIIFSVEILSELGIGYVLKRSSLAIPFVLSAAPLLFTVTGRTLLVVPVGFAELTITQQGLERFGSIAIKSWVSLQAAIVLSAATPFPDLLVAMRAVKVPRLLVAIFGLMWRYLFVLADEALRLIRARASRSGVSDAPGAKVGGSLIWRARVTGGMAGNLFLRAYERSDRIYVAMASRGYDGEVRAFALPRLPAAQSVMLAAGIGLLVALLLFAYRFWG